MPGPFVHRIDPVLGQAAGVCFWWYGLSYTVAFLELFIYLRRRRHVIRLSDAEVYSLTLWFAIGALVGGRAIEVAFDEWPFYRSHLSLIPAFWLGGMATHGLLLGAAAAIAIFCRLRGRSIREIADALVIPGVFFLAAGRIGNFIDGQIVGRVTDGWWGVQFPYAEGFRHPVVLYDALKNLLLIPLLLWIGKRRPRPGAMAAHFVFWYAFLRIFVDLFRDYPLHRLPLGTGQTLNIVMTAAGAVLIVRSEWKWRRDGREIPESVVPQSIESSRLRLPRAAFASLLVFCLTIPGNWTQDIPAKYGGRHPGLQRSFLYPVIDTRPVRMTAETADPPEVVRLRAP